jgi:predicted secreted hydrolase
MRNWKSTCCALICGLLVFGCGTSFIIKKEKPTSPLNLPADEAAHHDWQTEWWYYTGHMFTDNGEYYGFELCFFKRLIDEEYFLGFIPATWLAANPSYVAHFAVTIPSKQKFIWGEANNLAPWRDGFAREDRFQVVIDGWQIEAESGGHRLQAEHEGYKLDLMLVPGKSPALHGNNGIVPKHGDTANYYYSYSRMNVSGAFLTPTDDYPVSVTGQAWMDHEFGYMQMDASVKGWHWFALQLDDDTELMVYHIYLADGSIAPAFGGSIIDKAGNVETISHEDFRIEVLQSWTSPDGDREYPVKWKIVFPEKMITLGVSALHHGAELHGVFPLTYWEGPAKVDGRIGEREVSGLGFVEMVGHDLENTMPEK